jgi:hypothetical protein
VMVMEISEISQLLVGLLLSRITIATHYYK